MYEIKIDDKIIFFPGDSECVLSEAKLKLEVGNSGELTITLPSNNPQINNIHERNIVTVYKNEVEYWRGDVRETSSDFLDNKTFYCVEDLAFLGEVIKYAHSETKTYAQYFEDLLTEYNSKVNNERKFEIGYINKNPGDTRTFEFDTMSILEILREIADDYYVRVRRTNGHRYIDIVSLSSYGKSNNQPIEFAENLMDFVKESNTSYLLTSILPLGAELDTETIPGINDRVTIESVNSGSKVLINNTALSQYGYIEKIVEFESITDPNELKAEATNYLTRNSQPRLTMQIKVIDLSWIDNVDSFEIGDVIHIICEPFGIDQNITLTEMDEDILDPTGNELTLSSEVAKRTITDIQNEVYTEVKELPTKSEVLTAAKNNALKLLNGNDGGYVTFKFNNDNTAITDIEITDQATEENSVKKWVWNLSGLGYMYRNNITDPWTNLGVAMTMNGQIVGDFITAGTIDATRVNVTNVVASSVAAENITGTTITGKSLSGCTLRSASSGDYVDIKNGDIFGGDGLGQHGYISFSTYAGGQRAVAISAPAISLTGSLYTSGLKGVDKVISVTNAYVDGAMRQAVGLNFTNGILTNVTY